MMRIFNIFYFPAVCGDTTLFIFFCEIFDGKIVINEYENAPESLIKKLEVALEKAVDKTKEFEFLREHCKYFFEIVAEGLLKVEE